MLITSVTFRELFWVEIKQMFFPLQSLMEIDYTEPTGDVHSASPTRFTPVTRSSPRHCGPHTMFTELWEKHPGCSGDQSSAWGILMESQRLSGNSSIDGAAAFALRDKALLLKLRSCMSLVSASCRLAMWPGARVSFASGLGHQSGQQKGIFVPTYHQSNLHYQSLNSSGRFQVILRLRLLVQSLTFTLLDEEGAINKVAG